MSVSFGDFQNFVNDRTDALVNSPIGKPVFNILNSVSQIPGALLSVGTNLGNSLASLLSGNGLYVILGILVVGGGIFYYSNSNKNIYR